MGLLSGGGPIPAKFGPPLSTTRQGAAEGNTMARKRSRKHKEFDDATGVTDEEVKVNFPANNSVEVVHPKPEAEPEIETTPESDAVARKMLADAPARAAEKRRVDVKVAQGMVQHKLSLEERVAQLEAQAGLSPIVGE